MGVAGEKSDSKSARVMEKEVHRGLGLWETHGFRTRREDNVFFVKLEVSPIGMQG